MNRLARVIQPVVAQHAEEAAFLWLLRNGAVRAPHYKLWELTRLDQRVEAHLDGLRTAGDAGWELAAQQLQEHPEPGESFAAGVLALERGALERTTQVIDLGTATPEASRGLISALGWLPSETAEKPIRSLLNAEALALKRVGIAAAAAHRLRPRGDILQGAFASDDLLLKARAFRAAGELGLVDTHITLRANLRAKDPTARFWAAWSNALLNGHKEAVAYLQNVAEAGGPFAERAAQMAMRRLGPSEAKPWLKRLLKELGQKRIAIIAAGAFADPEAIPFLIDQMKAPKLARVAGESFSMITGANIAYEDLDGEKPEGFEAGPTENPEDEKVAMDADLGLAWPDPALVQKWWNSRQGNFSKGTRYLVGQPITPESLREALKNGYQRQRAAAALELAILNPGRPLFEVRTPGWRQQAML
jgi:uncharacterized protein (TIGR02270 family)